MSEYFIMVAMSILTTFLLAVWIVHFILQLGPGIGVA
jgi:hypothetical protein